MLFYSKWNGTNLQQFWTRNPLQRLWVVFWFGGEHSVSKRNIKTLLLRSNASQDVRRCSPVWTWQRCTKVYEWKSTITMSSLLRHPPTPSGKSHVQLDTQHWDCECSAGAHLANIQLHSSSMKSLHGLVLFIYFHYEILASIQQEQQVEVPGQVHSKLSQTSAFHQLSLATDRDESYTSYTPVQLTRDWSRPTKALDVGRLCCGHTVLELSADADRSGWTKAKKHNDKKLLDKGKKWKDKGRKRQINFEEMETDLVLCNCWKRDTKEHLLLSSLCSDPGHASGFFSRFLLQTGCCRPTTCWEARCARRGTRQ